MDDWLERALAVLERRAEHGTTLTKLEARRAALAPADQREHDELTWQIEELRKLIAGLAEMKDGTVPAVERRKDYAAQVQELTVDGRDAASRWREARTAIRALPVYRGLDLMPQLGLRPLGADPESGLWEFAHPFTGEVPERVEGGRLRTTDKSGIVLVLVPNGRFWMGSQRSDPAQPNYDPQARPDEPVRELEIGAFFIAKWEMTQWQWLQVERTNPSSHPPGHPILNNVTFRHPVENVSWSTARNVLGYIGMRLPTEAEWEYAARAGTRTPWHTGAEAASTQRAGNLADQSYQRYGPGTLLYESWTDGHIAHAPVGCFEPNRFGLYDTIGNVWEWCENWYTGPFGGLKLPPMFRVTRGGGWDRTSIGARSAYRDFTAPAATEGALGVRPARSISN